MDDGVLPEGWKFAKLSELGEVNRGRSRHRPRYAEHLYNGPYPFIQTGDIRTSGGRITSHTSTYSEAGLAQSRLWPAETMCITIAANIAETALLTYPACFPDSVVGFIADPKRADVRFVEYAFRLLKRRLQQEAMGSVQDNINLEILSRLQLPMPSLTEQKDVAAVLGALDDKIGQNRRTSEALERLARATFKAWFVDFEPVRAKADGAKSFPGMPAEAFAALPSAFTDSPLGAIPNGWTTPPLNELVLDSKERVGMHDVPAYSSTNEGVFPRDERFTKTLSKSQEKYLLIRRGDLIFGLSREILNFGVMYDELGAVSPVYKVFRPRNTILTPRYLEMMIQERVGYYRQVVKSSSREGQGIVADYFLRLSMLLPQEEVLGSYKALENITWQMLGQLRQESAKLAELRDYLLPRLLSGQVRVKDITGA